MEINKYSLKKFFKNTPKKLAYGGLVVAVSKGPGFF